MLFLQLLLLICLTYLNSEICFESQLYVSDEIHIILQIIFLKICIETKINLPVNSETVMEKAIGNTYVFFGKELYFNLKINTTAT